MQFELQKDKSSIIKVVGVGGGGSNAVNHMYNQGIKGVDFMICNTDAQALELSPVPNKIQLGSHLTEGRGAGSVPEVGRESALESLDEIKEILGSNTKMIFITAGMGGGTGTGAAPVIAQAARELDILTVGIVTVPFSFEGKKRRLQADEGIAQIREHVDALLIISNDRLRELHGNLSISNAFGEADNVLTTAAKGIAEIITVPGYINVDFEDVKKVMKNSGVAIMGSGTAEGENRAILSAELALTSPLLSDNQILGAENILLNITSGINEVTMDEITQITDYIQDAAGLSADMIWGNCQDETLGEAITVTLIATGFKTTEKEVKTKKVMDLGSDTSKDKPKVYSLDESNEGLTDEHEPVVKTKEEKKQVNLFDFISSNKTPEGYEPHRLQKNEENDEKEEEQLDPRVNERRDKLKEMSFRLNSTEDIINLENVPAYKRKNVNLEEVDHSSKPVSDKLSRHSLDEGDEGERPGFKGGNSFLHDQVD